MIHLFASIWAAVACTVYFLEFARLHLRIRFGGWQPFNRKPFNCEACLPFWLVAVFLLSAIYLRNGLAMVLFIAAASTAGILTPIIIKAIRK